MIIVSNLTNITSLSNLRYISCGTLLQDETFFSQHQKKDADVINIFLSSR